MWKKILVSIILIIVVIFGIEFFYVSKKEEQEELNNNIIENETEISNKYVTDDCINEWADYSETVQEEIEEASKIISDENRHYILREKDGFVNVYYINEDNKEILYKVTEISTKYLGEEDVSNLKIGIDVYGAEELNKLLEDFE